MSLDWTPLDQLESVTTPDDTVTYSYDGDGQRVSKISSSGTVHYVRDGAGNVIQEYDGNGNLMVQYVYAGSRRVAKIAPDGGRSYYHGDAVETPLVMTDQDGAQTWRGENRPFGEEASSVGEADVHRFTGKELEDETGLQYFGARFYDPAVGRFISTDPVLGDTAIPQRLNRYAYARNNPLRLVDPDGRDERPVRLQFFDEVTVVANAGTDVEFLDVTLKDFSRKNIVALAADATIRRDARIRRITPAKELLLLLTYPDFNEAAERFASSKRNASAAQLIRLMVKVGAGRAAGKAHFSKPTPLIQGASTEVLNPARIEKVLTRVDSGKGSPSAVPVLPTPGVRYDRRGQPYDATNGRKVPGKPLPGRVVPPTPEGR